MRRCPYPGDVHFRVGAPVNILHYSINTGSKPYIFHGTVVGGISRNDVDFVGIILDTIKDSFGKWAVIFSMLVVSTTGGVMCAKD